MTMKMTMAEFVVLEPCPFCKGEAFYNPGYNGGNVECRECGAEGAYKPTEAEAIVAWNTRVDYHGYEQAAIEAWESIKAWNSRAERTCKMQPSPFTDWAGLNMRIVAGWYCENCGECCLTETTIDDDHPTPNYCPNCGAKVVGE